MLTSILWNTDSYKHSMHLQYPPDTNTVYSYIESRGGIWPSVKFFGLQAFIKEYLLTPIKKEDIELANYVITKHGLPFYKEMWEYILKEYNGYLPIKISAAKEGSIIPTNNILVSVQNTDPRCKVCTTFVETALLRGIWYPTSVATLSYYIKKLLLDFLQKTGDESLIEFKLHDFGARGCSSYESASLGGMAHLLNFKGTDTVSALIAARNYYNADIAGFSIPASEHSTITSWGKEHEEKAFSNMIDSFCENNKIIACVSDSFDIGHACSYLWGEKLKQKIIDNNCTLIVRPDSGNPKDIVLECLERLGEKFGFTVNEKGYKVLNYVRVIQGDGINYDSIKEISENFIKHNWSMDNVSFGMGGALLGSPQRDDLKWAMKCSSVNINCTWVDVFKNPRDDASKKSKKGRLELIERDSSIITVNTGEVQSNDNILMSTIFENGILLKDLDWESIR